MTEGDVVGTSPAGREQSVIYDFSLITDDDLHLFNEGTHRYLFQKLGSHPLTQAGIAGTHFAVWAPNAEKVSVIGNYNRWEPGVHSLRSRGNSGIWEGFIPGVHSGAVYKYHIVSRHGRYHVEKADPYALASEVPPRTASIVMQPSYAWQDSEWMKSRKARNTLKSPISIYEVHVGSWM